MEQRVAYTPIRGLVALDGQHLDGQQLNGQSENVLSRVSQQLSLLEKRDWELWVIVSLAGLLAGVGLLAVATPSAFLKQGDVHFEITVSKQLAIGFFTLLILLNSYLASKRIELRRTREKFVSSTIQNELVRLQSFTDPLTEVYNRRSLDDMAGRYISHARRLKNPLTFFLIDVDRFKDVNTRFGHLTGDVVLAEVAALLRSSVRGSDAVVRYGGDEFLVILADTNLEGAQKVLARITNYLRDWNDAGHLKNFALSLTIGAAQWEDGKTLDEMLDVTDRHMYAEKKASVSHASA